MCVRGICIASRSRTCALLARAVDSFHRSGPIKGRWTGSQAAPGGESGRREEIDDGAAYSAGVHLEAGGGRSVVFRNEPLSGPAIYGSPSVRTGGGKEGCLSQSEIRRNKRRV